MDAVRALQPIRLLQVNDHPFSAPRLVAVVAVLRLQVQQAHFEGFKEPFPVVRVHVLAGQLHGTVPGEALLLGHGYALFSGTGYFSFISRSVAAT